MKFYVIKHIQSWNSEALRCIVMLILQSILFNCAIRDLKNYGFTQWISIRVNKVWYNSTYPNMNFRSIEMRCHVNFAVKLFFLIAQSVTSRITGLWSMDNKFNFLFKHFQLFCCPGILSTIALCNGRAAGVT